MELLLADCPIEFCRVIALMAALLGGTLPALHAEATQHMFACARIARLKKC